MCIKILCHLYHLLPHLACLSRNAAVIYTTVPVRPVDKSFAFASAFAAPSPVLILNSAARGSARVALVPAMLRKPCSPGVALTFTVTATSQYTQYMHCWVRERSEVCEWLPECP